MKHLSTERKEEFPNDIDIIVTNVSSSSSTSRHHHHHHPVSRHHPISLHHIPPPEPDQVLCSDDDDTTDADNVNDHNHCALSSNFDENDNESTFNNVAITTVNESRHYQSSMPIMVTGNENTNNSKTCKNYYYIYSLFYVITIIITPTESHNNHHNNRNMHIFINESSSGHCPTCFSLPTSTNYDHIKVAKIDAIKYQILSKLHMNERPKMAGIIKKPTPPELLRIVGRDHKRKNVRKVRGHHEYDFVEEFSDDHDCNIVSNCEDRHKDRAIDDFEEDEFIFKEHENGENYFAKTSEILTFGKYVTDVRKLENLLAYEFDLPNMKDVEITSMTLWVKLFRDSKRSGHSRGYFGRLDALDTHPLKLYVFKLNDHSIDSLEHVATKKIHSIRPGMKQIHINHAVIVTKLTNQSLTLLVDCIGCHHHGLTLLPSMDQTLAPFLIVNTQPKISRNRRYTNRPSRLSTCQPSSSRCCRVPFYVSIRDLKWDDWILYPSGYWANVCSGGCGTRRGHPSDPTTIKTFHAHVMSEYRLMNPFASIAPCCSPTKLSSMSLIYYDHDGRIVKSDLPNMIVDDCGCT